MARYILIHHVPAELKFQIEQLPRYRYGCANDLYIDALRFLVQSPEARLNTINQRVTDLESRIWRVCSQLERLVTVVPQLETRVQPLVVVGAKPDTAAPPVPNNGTKLQ